MDIDDFLALLEEHGIQYNGAFEDGADGDKTEWCVYVTLDTLED